MPLSITRIKLINYRRFKNYIITPKPHINVLVGDNEVGKSSILEAIDLVASGNVRRVESKGIDRLLNIDSVQEFISGTRTFKNLPKMTIELYLEGDNLGHSMNGKNNTDGITCFGIRLVCVPNLDYQIEIMQSIQ